jgi:type IV pilus assembly protein PilC
MPTFKYVALDPSGARVKGELEAASAVRARSDLMVQNLRNVEVKERKPWAQIEITTKKIKPVDVQNFSRQLAAFLRAGIPILDALDSLEEDAPNPVLKHALVEIGDALRAGSSFADAVAAHDNIFPRYYVSILRSAELTGNLDIVLDQLSAYIERDEGVRRSIRSALTYPLVVAAMAAVTVLVLVTYVLPKFKDFFDDLHATLPLPTRMLMGFADFLENWGLVIVGIVVVLIAALVFYLRTEEGKVRRDRFLLNAPAVGPVVQCAVIERFCRILGTMLGAGVPIPDAMTAASDATNNRVFQAGLDEARLEMLRGNGIAGPVAATGLFPSSAMQMLKVGEQSGTLDHQLVITADYFEQELDHKLKRLTSLFEPAVIIVMGAIVGFVAIALVSAMYGIFNQVKIK